MKIWKWACIGMGVLIVLEVAILWRWDKRDRDRGPR